MSMKRLMIAGAALLILGFIAACDETGNEMRETQTVALDGATRAEVRLQMGAGELRVNSADQPSLLEASFAFNRERLRPEVSYRVVGDKGILDVRHARRHGINFGPSRNRWDLVLGRAVPYDLDINLGAGHSDVDLRGLKLERVEMDMGVGEVNLDLRGSHASSFKVKIDGGVGSARLNLPSEVGVRVKVDGGLGSVNPHGLVKQAGAYVNEAYGKSPVTIDIDINAGIGSLDLYCGPSDRIRT